MDGKSEIVAVLRPAPPNSTFETKSKCIHVLVYSSIPVNWHPGLLEVRVTSEHSQHMLLYRTEHLWNR